ncbi:MAG: hypothetical protein ACTSQI_12330 [Candidatus Helarchaeota archaeon]
MLTKRQLRQRMEYLNSNFLLYIKKFDDSKKFTGPSVYFHSRTLGKRRAHETLETVFDDELFFEYLYATLTSWGMHRMGQGAKLVEFVEFVESIKRVRDNIIELKDFNILEINKIEVPLICEKLWCIIDTIKVNIAKTKLVCNTKILHHFLPELSPPIDREHTLRFFFNTKNGNLNKKTDEKYFRLIFPYFHYIGVQNSSEIKSLIGRTNFYTSSTKVIDNAIVGFVIKELKKRR